MSDNVVSIFKNKHHSLPDTLESLYAEFLRECLSGLAEDINDPSSVLTMIGIFTAMTVAFKAQHKNSMAAFMMYGAHDLQESPELLKEIVEQVILELES